MTSLGLRSIVFAIVPSEQQIHQSTLDKVIKNIVPFIKKMQQPLLH
jgi:hypothetical protein